MADYKDYNEQIQTLLDEGKTRAAEKLRQRRNLIFGDASHTNEAGPDYYSLNEQIPALGRMALHGATLGLKPRIQGAVEGAHDWLMGKPFVEGYEAGTRRAEAQTEIDRERGYPFSQAAEFLGSVGSSAAASMPRLMRPASLGSDITRNTALGAAEGALSGFGNTRIDEPAGSNVAVGVVTGGAAGGLSPVVGRTVGRAGGIPTVDYHAYKQLQDDLGEVGLSVDEVVTALQRPGEAPEGRLSDFMPRATRDALQSSGRDTQAGRDFLHDRQKGTQERMRAVSHQALRVPEGVEPYDWFKRKSAEREQIGQEMYDPIRHEYVDIQGSVAPFETIEEFRDAMGGLRNAVDASTSRLSGERGIGINTVGEFLEFKRLMYDKINATYKEAPQRAHDLRMRFRELESTIEEKIPELAEARHAYAGASAIKDAYELGAGTPFEMSAKGHFRQLKEAQDWFKGASDSEVEAYRLGLGESIQAYLSKNVDDSTNAMKFVRNSDSMKFLKSVMPADTWEVFNTAAQSNLRMQEAYTALGNSNTAEKVLRQAERQAIQQGRNKTLSGMFKVLSLGLAPTGIREISEGLAEQSAIINGRAVNNKLVRQTMLDADQGLEALENLRQRATGNAVQKLATAENLARGGTRQHLTQDQAEDDSVILKYLEGIPNTARRGYQSVTGALSGEEEQP